MPKAPGWQLVSTVAPSAQAGTTALSLLGQPGTLDGDILLMCLSHKGTDWAVVPAGWTLVARDVDPVSGIRGEMHWRRAASEPGSYSVTGLADTALGVVLSYRGGKATGDVVNVSAVAVNGASDKTGPFTVTVANALIVAMTAAADNNIATSSTHISAFPEIVQSNAACTGNTTNGTDCGLGVHHAMMVVPGVVSAAGGGSTSAGNVSIAVALVPEVDAVTSGTRYYPTKRAPRTRIEDLAAGDWTRPHHVGMTTDLMWPETMVLSQTKVGGGALTLRTFSTNQNGASVLLGRFLTPPLAAQTISGTLDLIFRVNSRWEDALLGQVPGGVVRYKLHVFITEGQSGRVRTVLADNFVDSAAFSTAANSVWMQLAVPIALTESACLSGDSVCIEFGAYVESINTPVPHYPPDEWNFSVVSGFGVAQDTNDIPFIDATISATGQRAAWFDFSHTFVELPPAVPPPNDRHEDAIDITAWPFTSPLIDVTGADSPARSVWFKFTPPTTRRCIITMLGSNYDAVPWLFTEATVLSGNLTASTQAPMVRQSSGGVDHGRCDRLIVADVQAGTTYYVRVHTGRLTTADGGAGQSAGGMLRLSMSWYEPPGEDDIFVPAANVYRLRDGVIVDVTDAPRFSATTGLALDYTQAPMADFNSPSYPAPTHTGHRLLIALHGVFGSPSAIEVFDAATLPTPSVIAFFDNAFGSSGIGDAGLSGMATLSMNGARLHVAAWGDGYLVVNGGGTTLDAAYYNADASQASLRAVRHLDDLPAVVLDEFGAQALRATPHIVPIAPIAPWHIQVADDGHTLYYVAGGWYFDESQIAGLTVDHRATTVKRFDLATDTPLADVATIPLSPGPREGLYGLSLHPSGQVLVCNGPTVNRISADGQLIQTYTFPEAKCRALVDVVFTADGRAFWVFDGASATVFKVDVVTGDILLTADTYFWARVTTQLAIYQPDGITPPEGEPPTGPPGPPTPPATTIELARRRWMRRATHLSEEDRRSFHHEFQLDMEVGVGNADAPAPKVMLRFSDDGGHTWSNEHWREIGEDGDFGKRVRWQRLGYARDRVYEVSGSDPVKIALIDAHVRATAGMH